jgi:hypothetical protein
MRRAVAIRRNTMTDRYSAGAILRSRLRKTTKTLPAGQRFYRLLPNFVNNGDSISQAAEIDQ